EIDTSNLTLNYTVYASLDFEEFNNYNCSNIPSALLAFAGVCLGFSIFGLVGNGLVMWFLGFHMKQNPFTVYTLNLAVADFFLTLLLFLLIMAFFSVATFCTSVFHLVDIYRVFVLVLGFLCHLFDLSSLGLLAALSVERCVSVL
ncbi:MRGRH protein, partial [Pitta sordida]|nr:MRGRH protein [Pitta sordida]